MVVRVIIAALGLEECGLSLGLNWDNRFEIGQVLMWNRIDQVWYFPKMHLTFILYIRKAQLTDISRYRQTGNTA